MGEQIKFSLQLQIRNSLFNSALMSMQMTEMKSRIGGYKYNTGAVKSKHVSKSNTPWKKFLQV